jgi:hypothetical protein
MSCTTRPGRCRQPTTTRLSYLLPRTSAYSRQEDLPRNPGEPAPDT